MNWRPLLHRWFIQYNPLYLLSALVVLAGLTLISHDSDGSGYIEVPAAIAELYACSLIAGAALLTRIGHRRPGVLLGLLAAVYQCDLMLFTERSAYPGFAGDVGVVMWLGVFVGKLLALAWALRLRLSRSAVLIPVLGALTTALLPRALANVYGSEKASVVAFATFLLFAAALWTRREVTSRDGLDAWGTTVLRRGVRATWIVWGVGLVAHVVFNCLQRGVSIAALLPVAILLSTRGMRTEGGVWAATAGALALAGWLMPNLLSSVAWMSAIVLALRALRMPARSVEGRDVQPNVPPYRANAPHDNAPPPPRRIEVIFARAPRASMLRLLTGSLSSVYLASWTSGWTGGDLPPHRAVLDIAFTLAAVLLVWRLRVHFAAAPVVATFTHLGIEMDLVSAPTSAWQWGISAIAVGFGLLGISLAVSFWLRPRPAPDPDPDPAANPEGMHAAVR